MLLLLGTSNILLCVNKKLTKISCSIYSSSIKTKHSFQKKTTNASKDRIDYSRLFSNLSGFDINPFAFHHINFKNHLIFHRILSWIRWLRREINILLIDSMFIMKTTSSSEPAFKLNPTHSPASAVRRHLYYLTCTFPVGHNWLFINEHTHINRWTNEKAHGKRNLQPNYSGVWIPASCLGGLSRKKIA